MNRQLKHSFYFSLTITLLFNFTNQVNGQEKFNISAGLGFPELLNAGLQYEFKQAQLGFSVGTFPRIRNESYLTISGDIYYHFGGYSKFSDRRLWYVRFGLTYYRKTFHYISSSETSILAWVYPYTRIGRDFNISNKIGINFDLGIFYIFPASEGLYNIPVYPSAELGLFYRL